MTLLDKAWSRVGAWVGRLPIAFGIALAAATALVLSSVWVERHMRIKVEASDLLPSDHPKNKEFEFIRATFKGSSRGFFVVVEAPPVRLRQVVPPIAHAFEALPEIEFLRYRLEREYFEKNFLLFQSQGDLQRQAGYLAENRADVARLLAKTGSLADMADGISDIVEGEQELSAPTDEKAKDLKLARDVSSLVPFLRMARRSLERAAAGDGIDPPSVDRGVEDLLLRGWFNHEDVGRLDRELLVPDDIWDKDGDSLAIIWIATQKSDFDPDFTRTFMAQAESIRGSLARAYPDVKLHFTGGIASYNTYAHAALDDFARANILGLIAILVLLVIGLRAVTPFVVLMILLVAGTTGTLMAQNLLFHGVNMIATAGALAVIGIGSDYGIIFLLAQRQELAHLERQLEATHGTVSRRDRLKALRTSMQRALASIGKATTVGCLVAALSFLALSSSDVAPFVRRVLGLGHAAAKSFQPIRELGVGAGIGLVYCLVLMLIALPASIYLVEWVRLHPLVGRLRRAVRPAGRFLRRRRRWQILKGRVRLFLATDYERRWFRALAKAAIRRRFLVIGVSLALTAVSAVLALRVGWSAGQKEVEPRHSEAVTVSEKIEARFGKSFENLLVYGPLDTVRRLHKRLEALKGAPDSNVGDVVSIDDYLPDADEPQQAKIELAEQIDERLRNIRPLLPPSYLLMSEGERSALAARLGEVAHALAVLPADPATVSAFQVAVAQLTLLQGGLASARPLEPASDWGDEVTSLDIEVVRAAREACTAAADGWLEAQVAQNRIHELKRIGLELEAALQYDAQPGLATAPILRRDLVAAALALEDMGANGPAETRQKLAEVAARLRAGATTAVPPGAEQALSWLERERLTGPELWLQKLVDDSGAYRLRLAAGADAAAFDAAMDSLERSVSLLRLRLRESRPHPGAARERLLASAYRLRRSLGSLRSFAAVNGFASVGPELPAADAAVDQLIAAVAALPEARADGVVGDFDRLLSERLFDRFNVVRQSARFVRKPLGIDDVPESARRLFRGESEDGQELYLARVLPRRSMLQRQPFEQIQTAVDKVLASLPGPSQDEAAPAGQKVGYSGFEALLNLATDYLEDTFKTSILAVMLLGFIALYLLQRSLVATLITIAPVTVGTLMTLAFMSVTHMHISIFTVVAIPIIMGVSLDSSIQVFRGYWEELSLKGHVRLANVMGSAGKVVTLNAFSTVLPFGMLMFGEMKGLVALGTLLAIGLTFCFIAKLVLLPCLISVVHDFIVPTSQYARMLYPRKLALRLLRAALGAWQKAVPKEDPGFTVSVTEQGVMIVTFAKPPINLMDAPMVCGTVEAIRTALEDPFYKAVILRSGLPSHYHIEDMSGHLLVDAKGKPKRIPASLVERDPPPPGFRLVGPIRPYSGGADLKAMAANPLNAFFALLSGRVGGPLYWYARKPLIWLAEGDLVAGAFESALHFNYFMVTRHARVGAPEVKRGLTLPFGAHALSFRAGTSGAQHLMTSGEMIEGEAAVRKGIADHLIPEGEDPNAYAIRMATDPEVRDKVHQTAMLRQYGPPIGRLIQKSIRNYVRLIRSGEARQRIKEFIGRDLEA